MDELGGVVTSESLGPMLEMNPAALRRTMAGLREAGIVRAVKGHGGGWALARALDSVSLGEVYAALGRPAVFNIGPRIESPGCLVEQAVNRAVTRALDDAESLLMERLGRLSIANIAMDVRRKGSHLPRKKGSKPHV
jgi:DNA-binding IscR family transcriptional regulator